MNPEQAQISDLDALHTLQVLEAVQLRLLMEAWTTVLLTGILIAALLFQIAQHFRLRKSAALVSGLAGYGLFYLPSEIGPLFAHAFLWCSVMLFLREWIIRPVPMKGASS